MKWIVRLLSLGYISLLIQNILILTHISITYLLRDLLIQLGFPLPLFEISFHLMFHLDLLGFFIIAVSSIGYAITSLTELKKKHHLIGGFCLFCWVVCRGLNQYGYLLPRLVFNENMIDIVTFWFLMTPFVDWPPTLPAEMIILYIFSSIFLAIASIFIGVHEEIANRLFILYALTNIVAVVLHSFLPLNGIFLSHSNLLINSFGGIFMIGGYMMKGLLIPLLGIMTFGLMLVTLKGTPHWAMEEEYRSCIYCGEKYLQETRICPYCLK